MSISKDVIKQCLISVLLWTIRQKHKKPLAVDARCLLRAIDAVPVWKSPKQAWIFSVSHTITLSGLCIHRKAINKNKPFCLACGSLARSRIPSSGQGRFILVYRLAMDARPWMGDGVAGWKYPSLLEGFSDGHSINGSQETSCINRKGFIWFLSYGQHSQD